MTARVIRLHPLRLEARGRVSVLHFDDGQPGIVFDPHSFCYALHSIDAQLAAGAPRVVARLSAGQLTLDATMAGCGVYVLGRERACLTWLQVGRFYEQLCRRLNPPTLPQKDTTP